MFNLLTIAGSFRFWRRYLTLAALLLLSAHFSTAAVRSPDETARVAQSWINKHPLIKKENRTLGDFLVFPKDATYRLHIFRLNPSGYLILHSESQLPLIVAFSTDSPLDLENLPENTFRAFLTTVAESAAEQLAQKMKKTLTPRENINYPPDDFVFGPYLSSSWNQTNPYNLYASDDPTGTQNWYDGRTPIGCVPLALSQLLYFHRWPLRGFGASSYTDTSGSIRGTHTADYSDPYDWDHMLDIHSPSDSVLERQAIGELAYELAVAANADFESNGTATSMLNVPLPLQKHFYFEPSVYHHTYQDLQKSLDTDLMMGYPAIIVTPEHAVVADGLLRADSIFSYHINYGWGGKNNGWFAYDSIPNGPAITGGITLRPLHIPIPQKSLVEVDVGESCELIWNLPKRRHSEIDHLRIVREAIQANPWKNDASIIDTLDSTGWKVIAEGYPGSGSGWFAGPAGAASINLAPEFLPTSDTLFEFWLKFRLASNAFRICVSTDGGINFTELQRWSDKYPLNWQRVSISLGDYVNQAIILKLELLSGSYYDSGGVWVDEMTVTSGSRNVWETMIENPLTQIIEYEHQPIYKTVLTDLVAGDYTLAGQVVRSDGVVTPVGPRLKLSVNSVGIDPENGFERVKFTRILVDQINIYLHWTGSLNRWYQILGSNTLASDSWSSIITIQSTLDDEELSATIPLDNLYSFFRISTSRVRP
jgi:hypothetical protein